MRLLVLGGTAFVGRTVRGHGCRGPRMVGHHVQPLPSHPDRPLLGLDPAKEQAVLATWRFGTDVERAGDDGT